MSGSSEVSPSSCVFLPCCCQVTGVPGYSKRLWWLWEWLWQAARVPAPHQGAEHPGSTRTAPALCTYLLRNRAGLNSGPGSAGPIARQGPAMRRWRQTLLWPHCGNSCFLAARKFSSAVPLVPSTITVYECLSVPNSIYFFLPSPSSAGHCYVDSCWCHRQSQFSHCRTMIQLWVSKNRMCLVLSVSSQHRAQQCKWYEGLAGSCRNKWLWTSFWILNSFSF